MNKNETQKPLLGKDLEQWRVEHGLTAASAAQIFGLHRSKWDAITQSDALANPVDDPAVGMLYLCYLRYPTALPVMGQPDLAALYSELGFNDSYPDRDRFAVLLGRNFSSVYRWQQGGNAGKPVVRWIEALNRLGLTGQQKLELMEQIATDFAKQQGIGDVLQTGWKRQDIANDD